MSSVLQAVAPNDYVRCGKIYARDNKLFTFVCLKFQKKKELHNKPQAIKCSFSELVSVNVRGKE